jgi:hypothetical protein
MQNIRITNNFFGVMRRASRSIGVPVVAPMLSSDLEKSTDEIEYIYETEPLFREKIDSPGPWVVTEIVANGRHNSDEIKVMGGVDEIKPQTIAEQLQLEFSDAVKFEKVSVISDALLQYLDTKSYIGYLANFAVPIALAGQTMNNNIWFGVALRTAGVGEDKKITLTFRDDQQQGKFLGKYDITIPMVVGNPKWVEYIFRLKKDFFTQDKPAWVSFGGTGDYGALSVYKEPPKKISINRDNERKFVDNVENTGISSAEKETGLNGDMRLYVETIYRYHLLTAGLPIEDTITRMANKAILDMPNHIQNELTKLSLTFQSLKETDASLIEDYINTGLQVNFDVRNDFRNNDFKNVTYHLLSMEISTLRKVIQQVISFGERTPFQSQIENETTGQFLSRKKQYDSAFEKLRNLKKKTDEFRTEVYEKADQLNALLVNDAQNEAVKILADMPYRFARYQAAADVKIEYEFFPWLTENIDLIKSDYDKLKKLEYVPVTPTQVGPVAPVEPVEPEEGDSDVIYILKRIAEVIKLISPIIK